MPSTAPSTRRFRSTPEASYNENLMEEEPLFNTKIGKAAMGQKPFKRFVYTNQTEPVESPEFKRISRFNGQCVTSVTH
jgi:hypothetical protein